MRNPMQSWLAMALIGLMVAMPGAGLAQAEKKVDVSGTWVFSVTTDAGTGTPAVTFKQQGDSLTGRYSSQVFGEVDFKGTVKGNQIGFSLAVQIEGQALTVNYTGTVESADSMKGTVDFGGFGGGTFTGKRQ